MRMSQPALIMSIPTPNRLCMPCEKCPETCYSFLHHVQVCCVEFDRKDINMNKLVATSLEGKFHVFDMRTQHLTKGFASVSEKVIGWREPDGCLAPMYGKNVKRLLPWLLLFYIGVVRREMGAHVVLTVFTAGSVRACVCLTSSAAFVTPGQNWQFGRRGERSAAFCGNMLEKHT